MDKEPASNNSNTVDQQVVIKSPLHEPLPTEDTTLDESTQPKTHPLKENALSCQIKLTELLKVIANNKRASKNMVSDQHANPGPSGDSSKPLRKAKYSWQVKNLSGQTQNTATQEGGSQGQGLDEVGAGDSSEPPQKKPKLSEDIPSAISLRVHSNNATSDNESTSSGLPTARANESSAHSEGQTAFDGQIGETKGSEDVSEEGSRQPSTSNKSPGQVPLPGALSSRSSSVLAKWQSKHIAQSIVDNAINATLEVLGFSLTVGARHPGQAIMAAAHAAQGRTLEEDAVSVVIRARGLQGTEQLCSTGDSERQHATTLGSEIEDRRTHGQTEGDPIQSASHMNPLDPLLGRLTHFTETMSGVDHTTVASSATKGNAENQPDASSEADTLSSIESSLQTDVLNKAVCAAISQKGLAVDEDL